jgi:hypothetical protein
MFDLPDKAESNPRSDYVSKWKTAMTEAYRIAHEATTKSAEKGKKNYDRRIRYTDLQPGDRVLVRSPVYDLRPETGRGRNRVLHRNLLLPCEHLPLENWHELTRKTTETQRATKRVPRNESEDERSNSDSDTEDEFRVTVHQPERMEVNPDTPDPVQLEIDPANENGYIAEDILQDTVQENPEVVDEVQDHTNDTQANVSEENMHGDRNPENIIPDPEVQTDGNRVVRRRQPPQRFTYYGPGNPAYISPLYGEKVEQYLPVHNDYTNQPFHLPHPPPPVFHWNPPIPPPYGIPPAILQFWSHPIHLHPEHFPQ